MAANETKERSVAKPAAKELGDFTTTTRVVPIALLAIVIGILSSIVALALLRMIGFFTNLFYFQRFSTTFASPAQNHLGALAILVPVVGALIIGVIARYGSERIRGHGIPEAIESILLKGSRVEPRVAFLKPLSSAISIGSGGPFGAEGPIIMTGGAFGSMVAQLFHLTSAERKTLLVAGAAAGMSATFAAPVAAVLLAVELLLFEWKPRSYIPVALASATAAIVRPLLLDSGPLFPTRYTRRTSVRAPWQVASSSGCSPARSPAFSRAPCMRRRTSSIAFRSTGCGGPQSAVSSWASAASSIHARSASVTTSSPTCCAVT
jgi:H+/Cl- antiporter ClcA